MDIYEVKDFSEIVKGNTYPGRGIILGMSADGKSAVSAYFIMGRSVNSRNRVFEETADGIIIHAFDPSKLSDPSLVIYSPVRKYGENLIVTNGDQTDTVYDGLAAGKSFEIALESREFEPDAPNFTPRISGMISFKGGSFTYKMNILKSADAAGSACSRFNFAYPALAGVGHFLHTYEHDGNPIPTFQGEPERTAIPNGIDEFTDKIWNSLDAENKVSLYVRYDELATGKTETRILNKNK
ncbi:MAG: IMP cyclohydrolase [Lachnospiraceae bacterium]|nr:IMP cyclohydrolase [Lachnospiraceae bacterium]